MSKRTRRDFLRWTAAASGAMALGRLGAAAGQTPEPAPGAALPAMCIARWQGASVPDTELKGVAVKLTEQAIASLGGMKRFVSTGDVVWVKPNVAWNRKPEHAANTNPDVVATLVRLCLEAGAKSVKVGDHTCNDAEQSYANSGIGAAVKAVGGEMVYVDPSRFREAAINGKRLKTWPLYPEILETDLVINVPVVKHHNIATATMCMKNYMGVIGGERNEWHQDLGTCLCDITAYMKPRLCVLDAIRILTDHGPTGGNLADVKRLDTVAAGTDIVALDALGAELLGHKPESLETVAAGHAAGLGQMDYRKIACRELALS